MLIKLVRRAAIAAAICVAALAGGPAVADTGAFLGNWVNVDSGTRDITRIVVTPAGPNRVQVQVFGQCHPTDCDWGVQLAQGFAENVSSNDVRIITATYNFSFKRTLVILRLTPGGLHYQTLNEFTDNSGRSNYESTGMMRPAPVGPVLGAEDCIGFNPMAVQAANVNGSWKVVQGSMWMLDFGGDSAGAHRAVQIIRNYGFNQQCFVHRPHAQMTYWKVGNSVPSAGMPGQDCVDNNPATTQVQNVNGSWKIVDGSHWMLDFGSDQGAANQALAVIRHYRLNRQCFVSRPHPPMAYWLSE